jgi:eukaryotic-like serine/threonine-protein kinase
MAKLPTEERVGAIILGRYRIVRLIEKGGMGAVYEVVHKNLGRRFAVKMLSSELSRNEEALARFRREADAIARLRHPNIVDIVDWELMEDGSPVLVMEYLRGNTLADHITRHGPLGWGLFADVADRALSAIQVAHAAGIVHRDLKPANIFLAVDDAGQIHPKVLDFGVSKVVDSHTMLGTNPTILGTPSYMSPEQAEGRSREVGPATDVWAMGAVLYEMATGRMAFWGDSVPSILYMVCHGTPEPMANLRPDAPRRLVHVIERAMSRDPEQRVRDAGRLRRELRTALTSVSGEVHFDAVTPVPLFPGATPAPGVPVVAAQSVVDPDEPTRIETEPPDMPELAETGTVHPARQLRRRRAAFAMAAVGGALVVVVALAISLGGGGDDRGDPAPKRSAAPPAGAPRAPVVAPTATPAPAPVPMPVPAATPVEPAAPVELSFTIRSEPPGALVVDEKGARVGNTPFTVKAAKGSGSRSFLVRMRRYHDRRVDWSAEASEGLDVRLQRRSDRPSAGKPGGESVDPNATDNPFRTPR